MSETPATTDQPTSGPQNAGLRTAVRLGALVLVALAVISAIVWTLVDGTPGLWGALMGAGLGGAFVLITAVGWVIYFLYYARQGVRAGD